MVEPTTVSATFAPANQLSVSIEALYGATGSVKSVPAGIDCGTSGSAACAADFTPTATVRLSAYPGVSSTFAGWTGACTHTAGDCLVTMDQARHVAAKFSIPMRANLAVMLGGPGIVRTMYQNEIMCPGDCVEEYDVGSTVTLYAIPNSGATFDGWSGDGAACGSSVTCSLTITGPMVATALFQ